MQIETIYEAIQRRPALRNGHAALRTDRRRNRQQRFALVLIRHLQDDHSRNHGKNQHPAQHPAMPDTDKRPNLGQIQFVFTILQNIFPKRIRSFSSNYLTLAEPLY
ncbi:hypothetical protein PWG14_23635, partial [Chromobacterium amazonense]|uniref:hypothetical protein n=1 Tax=Chromobacterium amazonense TaxID=1382803 RepID=UPI00237E6302